MWLLFALSGALFCGLNYALGEKILKQISPVTLLAIQASTGLFLFPVLLTSNSGRTELIKLAQSRSLLFLTLLSALVFLTTNLSTHLAVRAKNATLASFVELCYPVFTILFTWLLFRVNHLTLYSCIGSLLITIGVLVISYGG